MPRPSNMIMPAAPPPCPPIATPPTARTPTSHDGARIQNVLLSPRGELHGFVLPKEQTRAERRRPAAARGGSCTRCKRARNISDVSVATPSTAVNGRSQLLHSLRRVTHERADRRCVCLSLSL